MGRRHQVGNKIEEMLTVLRETHEALSGTESEALATALDGGIMNCPDWEEIEAFAHTLRDYRMARAYFFSEGSDFGIDSIEMGLDTAAARDRIREDMPGLPFNAKIAAKNAESALAAAAKHAA